MTSKRNVLETLRLALMSPVTGPIATAVALAMSVALGVAASSWEAQRTAYEDRIAVLRRDAQQAEGRLKADLAACHAAAVTRDSPVAVAAAGGPTAAGARRLLERQPEGIDACARMESADEAVLQNLKK